MICGAAKHTHAFLFGKDLTVSLLHRAIPFIIDQRPFFTIRALLCSFLSLGYWRGARVFEMHSRVTIIACLCLGWEKKKSQRRSQSAYGLLGGGAGLIVQYFID